MDNETNRRMLHAMVGRADHVGHVILEAHEVTFARSDEGARWLEPIDPEKRLYKLRQEARQQLEPKLRDRPAVAVQLARLR